MSSTTDEDKTLFIDYSNKDDTLKKIKEVKIILHTKSTVNNDAGEPQNIDKKIELKLKNLFDPTKEDTQKYTINSDIKSMNNKFKMIHDEIYFHDINGKNNTPLITLFKNFLATNNKAVYFDKSKDDVNKTVLKNEFFSKPTTQFQNIYPLYILYLYSYCKQFFNIDSLDDDSLKSVYDYDKYQTTQKHESSSQDLDDVYSPRRGGLLNATQNKIISTYKKSFIKDDPENEISDTDKTDIITYVNIFNLLQFILKNNKILYFGSPEDDDNEDDEIVGKYYSKNLQNNPKYMDDITTTSTEIVIHFDIVLVRIEELEYLQYFLNLTGDVTKTDIPYYAKYTNKEYGNLNTLMITSTHKISKGNFRSDKLKPVVKRSNGDKRSIFLDSNLFSILSDYLKKKHYKESDEEADNPKILKHNVKLITDLFFKYNSKTASVISKKHKMASFYYNDGKGEKEYLINSLDIINYNYGTKTKDDSLKYNTIDVSFHNVTFDIDDIIKNYKKVDNVYYRPTIFDTEYLIEIKDICGTENSVNIEFINPTPKQKPKKTLENIPFTHILMRGSTKNLGLITSSVNYKKKKYHIDKKTINEDTKTVKLIDKNEDRIVILNHEADENVSGDTKRIYKVNISLELLDPATPITFVRKHYNKCSDKCQKIDNTLAGILYPNDENPKFNFFSKFFKDKKTQKKYKKIITDKFGTLKTTNPKEKSLLPTIGGKYTKKHKHNNKKHTRMRFRSRKYTPKNSHNYVNKYVNKRSHVNTNKRLNPTKNMYKRTRNKRH
jgi:hypothetical protein